MRVKEYLGALDVVVKVVAERVYQVDCIISRFVANVSRKQN